MTGESFKKKNYSFFLFKISENKPKLEDYLKTVDQVMILEDMIPLRNLIVINPNELKLNQHINFLLDEYINYDHLHPIMIQFVDEHLKDFNQ